MVFCIAWAPIDFASPARPAENSANLSCINTRLLTTYKYGILKNLAQKTTFASGRYQLSFLGKVKPPLSPLFLQGTVQSPGQPIPVFSGNLRCLVIHCHLASS
jgi:hypothetical protein